MSSTYGDKIKLTIFGESHGNAIGMVLNGIPAGLPVDMEELQSFLNRRAPGRNDYATSRKEADTPEFLSGILGGYTCGGPIAAIIRNTNTQSSDYDNLKNCPRPGHADYTAQIKYRGFQDAAGGGHFSGRLTAPLCIAGGLCKQWLKMQGIEIGAHILSIGCIEDTPQRLDSINPQLSLIQTDFPVINQNAGTKMQELIVSVKKDGDSVGGIIQCYIIGLPIGLGGPLFGGLEGKIAQAIYGIPAVKGIDFGAGFSASLMRGSENNDAFTFKDGQVATSTNHAGGILGGISNGMPVIFRAAFKPTPSIAIPQQTVNTETKEQVTIQVAGRHDPCIVPRAVPVVEAAAAIAIYDTLLNQ